MHSPDSYLPPIPMRPSMIEHLELIERLEQQLACRRAEVRFAELELARAHDELRELVAHRRQR